MTAITIRPTTDDDLTLLAEVYVASYNHLDIGERWDVPSAQQLLTYYFSQYPELAFTAEHNGKITGAFLSSVKPWWDGYHLFDGEIFVHHAHQQHGIGRQLLAAVFAAAKKHYNAVCWDFFTFTGRGSPVAWYEKIGISIPEGFTMMGGSLDDALSALNRGAN